MRTSVDSHLCSGGQRLFTRGTEEIWQRARVAENEHLDFHLLVARQLSLQDAVGLTDHLSQGIDQNTFQHRQKLGERLWIYHLPCGFSTGTFE